MSTKIYTGFRFDSDMDLYQIHEKLNGFRDLAFKIVKQEVYKWQANQFVYLFDSYTLGILNEELKTKVENNGCWEIASKELKERHNKVKYSRERDPDIDFSFEISILPLYRDKILGIYYCENDSLIKAWKSQFYIFDYHYQNQTDCPKNISSDEWEQRRKDWDKIFSNTNTPSMCGFIAQLVEDNYPSCSFELVSEYIPNLDDRAMRFSRSSLFDKRFDIYKRDCEMKKHEGSRVLKKDLDMSDWSYMFMLFHDWLDTKEGWNCLLKENEIIKGKLKSCIFKRDVM